MPWLEVENDRAVSLLSLPGTHYILFFASGTPPWCSDCEEAQQPLKTIFETSNAPQLNVVLVGDREKWKSVDNPWKGSKYQAREIPLLIKLVDGKQVGRLGEEDCKSEAKLRKLIQGV